MQTEFINSFHVYTKFLIFDIKTMETYRRVSYVYSLHFVGQFMLTRQLCYLFDNVFVQPNK